MSRQVKIIDPDDLTDPTYLPVTPNGIGLSCLKVFFPGAVGLKYYDKEKNAHGVSIEDNFLKLEPNVDEYYAVYPKGKGTSNQVEGDDNKRSQVIELASLLRLKRSSKKENESPNKSAIQKLKRKSTVDCNKVNEKLSKKKKQLSRSLVFGWVHKGPDDLHFKQILKPFGGLVSLELDCENDSYSAIDLKKEVISKFKTPKTESIFNQLCSIEIGLHDGQIIKDFVTPEGEACDLWEFLSCYNFSAKTHLYLVTMEKTTAFEHIGSVTSDKLAVNLNSSSLGEEPKVKVVENGVQTDSLFEMNSTSPLDTNDFVPKSNNGSMNQNSLLDVQVSSDTNNNTSDDSKCEGPLNKEKNKSDYPQVQVLYRRITKSEYTGHYGITNLSKTDLYDLLVHSDDGLNVSLEEFDPYDYGYTVSEIAVSGVELLRICTDPETLERSFHFPEMKLLSYHKIAYDLSQVHGFIGNEFGLGFIPTCTDHCEPIITFYKNDVVFKRGKFRYWIYIKAEDLGKWKFVCKSECNCKDPSTNTLGKSSVTVASSKDSTENLSKSIVPVLMKSEFTIGKEISGAGAQGTVRIGQYLGTEIAVKSINVINEAVMRDIRNEISVMEIVRHPNIIQILGVCCEKKKVHILMESFKNVSLFDLIFDEDAKLTYKLTVENKANIAKQICLAVAYLHGQSPPIIHRDIKTANIMINEHGVVKIGDFGMSKICKPAISLQSTTVRGTTLYMAPEIYVDKQPATIKSDIWSLGCALLELYSEETFGSDSGITNEAELLSLLKTGYKPKLESLPMFLSDIVNQCFALNPADRPSVFDIIKMIEKND